ncbi:toxin RelE [Mycobacterium gallinarum]|uniref:Toxin RelE n=1 Tax=Mycobacterium gallinarum TaxID=39689 RepID=A0A9W4AZL8_9MYCO|nr:type II toxin-antitoxin system RelE/ParE family toxin [Mycobacterium gallinarum]BBY91341.1 toxin RelE [Mycobacterium gallinarum]
MDELPLKPIKWLGTTLADLRAQRDAIRYELGHQIYRVQLGLWPNDFKPMSDVGVGAYEIRVRDADGIARVMYVAKFGDVIHVLHVFTKKAQKTPQSDIEKARERYKEARNG